MQYLDKGEGPPLLFLHGWAAPVETYRLLTDHLSGYCRVVAPDFPGFGGSEEPPAPWDVDGYVDFTLKFAAALGIGRAVLMGHSFGGRVIIKLMNRPGPPLEVPKIILMDAAGIKPKRPPSYYWKVYSFKAAKAFFRLPGVRRLFPDAVDTLKALRNKGYLLGIITNGPSVLQNRKLDVCALRPLVDLCVVSGDENLHKPDPEIFRRAASRMGVGCHNCVYVGDHPVNDIEGARRAGMRPIYINAFDGPLHPENVTEIHTLSELTEIF